MLKTHIYIGQISASLGALKKASDDLMQLAKREITEEKREIAYQLNIKININITVYISNHNIINMIILIY